MNCSFLPRAGLFHQGLTSSWIHRYRYRQLYEAFCGMPSCSLGSVTSPELGRPRSLANPSVPQFKQTYQAYLHYRKRNVKCIPLDHQGELLLSCARCPRERRICVFSEERRVQYSPQPPASTQRRTVKTADGTRNPSLDPGGQLATLSRSAGLGYGNIQLADDEF